MSEVQQQNRRDFRSEIAKLKAELKIEVEENATLRERISSLEGEIRIAISNLSNVIREGE